MYIESHRVRNVSSISLILAVVFVYSWSIQSSVAIAPKGKEKKTQIDVLFSPKGGCANRIIEEIDNARKTIRVQMYFFTSEPIADALIEAKERGIEVQVILDDSQQKAKYGRWRVLRRDGVTVSFDGEHATANNKIILIDRRTIITGSYNYTKAAEEKNAENVLIIRHAPKLFDKYLENFEKHSEHARR